MVVTGLAAVVVVVVMVVACKVCNTGTQPRASERASDTDSLGNTSRYGLLRRRRAIPLLPPQGVGQSSPGQPPVAYLLL